MKDMKGSAPRSATRRQVLQAGGAFVLAFTIPGCDRGGPRERSAESAAGAASADVTREAPGLNPNAFIRIDRSGSVTLVMHKVEMGQGTFTSIPMLIAEELEVDLSRVKLEQAPANDDLYADPILGGQITGASTSVRGAWEPLRRAGAAARMVLIEAAAQEWGVDANSCVARNGTVTHPETNRTLDYSQLVDAAAKLSPPSIVPLKEPADFKLIGKAHKRLDSPAKVNGSAKFGIDARLPGMRIATVAASPVPGGKLKSTEDAKALGVKGVYQVLKLDDAVAVVADHMWSARQGLAALAPTWSDGPHAKLTTAAIVAEMAVASSKEGVVARDDGDARQTITDSGRKLEAIYQMPFLAHATMEPMNCTVHVRSDACEIWCGTQVPAIAQSIAAKITGLPLEKVQVHNHYIGGGFGRRLEVDYVAQAVAFAKQMKEPLKVVWTREEDIQHGVFRPYYYDRLAASLDENGMPSAWTHRVTGSSITARYAPDWFKDGLDPDAVEGARDLKYGIPNIRVEYVRHEPPFATAYWRGVGATHNVWVVESFLDELATAAKKDPVEYRRALLADVPRLRAVLELAALKAGWAEPLRSSSERRFGRGVSAQFVFGTYMAQIAEVSVGKEGDVRLERVVCALDCGQVVNPDTIVAQIESGVVFGASAALWNEITFDRGRVQQSNFFDYRIMRINEMPRVEVHIIPSTASPGGIGEPGCSAIAPAITNAVFAATGKRIRKLPINAEELRSA
ncbi:xanthine dehydrogenase family protein molybdopterin-binding subunit [Steroidobacter sp. S1-65]|uniref:Xanthine dehydrogenase family protein molybdopterin-binding subunit n=2 Tax=Steroidobacter gossypii TaxID=2805490 RepID=A0ABS1WVB5_9GAMM|nr:xanthine dehydrogenase family protein molybdopterin-binding subunit [Steroidobacter gossypii]